MLQFSTKNSGKISQPVIPRYTKSHWLRRPLALGVAGILFNAAMAEAQTPPPASGDVALQTIVVKGRTSVQAARARLNKIPGGVSVIAGSTVTKKRAQTNADLLALQPGVYAGSQGGTDSIKISIRGSGINRGTGFFRSGILFTFDDLPVTTPSGTPYELFEPQGLDNTQIFRGDSAFTTGALALGGTINFVTYTGITHPYSEARVELGSFGYVKGALSTGKVVGPWDYYLLVTGTRQDGWQDHTNSDAEHIAGNIGYQFNADVDTRVYFRFGREYFASPGALTREQIESDPRQAQASTNATNYSRLQPGSELIGDVTHFHLGADQTIETDISYQSFPIWQGNYGNFVEPEISKWQYADVAAALKYTNNATLLRHGNAFTAAVYVTDDIYGSAQLVAAGTSGTSPYGETVTFPFGQTGPTGAHPYGDVTNGELLYKQKFNGSTDFKALLSDDYELVPHLWLTLGGAFIATPRTLNISGLAATPNTSAAPVTQFTTGESYSATHFNFAPYAGVRYDASSDLTLFASYGESVEPRNDWAGEYTPDQGVTGYYPNYVAFNFQNQTAKTFEFGLRGRYGIFQGSADYYHSSLNDEFLTIFNPVTDYTTEVNGPHTTHQGVEAALDTLLWQQGSGDWWSDSDQSRKIHLVQAYTYSRFAFDNANPFGVDPNGETNISRHLVEPGIPEHYYQGQLEFDDPSGVYVDFNAQVASGYYIDYLNTFRTAPYVIYGATIGWQQHAAGTRGWQVSLDADNLTNARYALDVSPVYDASHTDQPVEDAGTGFGLYGAVTYKF